ncbi:MAG: signal recognition particle-docking protein FtsY [Dehalococcoidia bacterium]|nr:signal recognition particle-docking protein FtsY [Dehalococcoidia bacterium]
MRFWRRKPKEDEAAESESVAVEDGPAAEAEAGPEAFTPEEEEEVREQTSRATERTRKGWLSRLGGIFERADFTDRSTTTCEENPHRLRCRPRPTERIVSRVQEHVRDEGVKQSERVREVLAEELVAVLEEPGATTPAWSRPDAPAPLVLLVIGVNGAGKTTSIAKMAHAFQNDGATVVLGAADTFRAAAIEQLQLWGERVGARVVAHQHGADPGAVAHDTIAAAESAGAEVVIIDTAGRLHTKSNLMDELKKVRRVVQRRYPDAPHETLLVLDATTGQNGLAQARTFTEAVGVTGIVLAKLDGTAKGGIAFAIAHELGLPVRFIGTGERMGDLAPFDPHSFVDSLLN